ncbi:MAG: GNAT family N-acetyltransferase [Oligoflexia bacterium]|nr:GNAT family N-acetyltransferase [Oligoflexia bacterium]
MAIHFEKVSSVDSRLREKYLNQLNYSQEFYLEWRVQAGTPFLIQKDEQTIGYAVCHNHAIVECYFLDIGDMLERKAFEQLLKVTNASSMLCKSFDENALRLAKAVLQESKTVGILFREFSSIFPLKSDVTSRPARPEDLEALLEINDNFFSGSEEILNFIEQERQFLYFNQMGELLGCGIVSQIVEGRNSYDVGMLVNPKHRKKGFGSHIIAHMARYCLDRGWVPVCGCSADNLASKKAIERAGFSGIHELIEFRFDHKDSSLA